MTNHSCSGKGPWRFCPWCGKEYRIIERKCKVCGSLDIRSVQSEYCQKHWAEYQAQRARPIDVRQIALLRSQGKPWAHVARTVGYYGKETIIRRLWKEYKNSHADWIRLNLEQRSDVLIEDWLKTLV